MDGMDLLQWMRANDPFKQLPFVMATAQADKTQQNAVAKEGGQGLIPKPFHGR
jgi:CheY-like chemotaxis protein